MRKMSKVFRISILLLLVSVMSIGFATTASAAESKPTKYTIEFRSRDYVLKKVFSAEEGKDVTSKISYTFRVLNDAKVVNGEFIPASIDEYKVTAWTPDSDEYTLDDLKNVQCDMRFWATYEKTQKVIPTVTFFVRLDSEQQYEDGNTHYNDEYYTEAGKGFIKEFKSINEANSDTYLDDIKANLIGDAPSVEDVDYEKLGLANALSSDKYEIKWYVLKKEGDEYHIDGVVVRKEQDTNVLNPANENPNPDELPVVEGPVNPEKDDFPEIAPEGNDEDGAVLGFVVTNDDVENAAEIANDEAGEVLGASYVKTGDTNSLFVVIMLLAISGLISLTILAGRKVTK